MLLRSITQHVKDQNWFAIAIDFMIVVFGVFVGIQVSNWNEDRLEQQNSKAYIERIRDDLAENKNDFNERLTYFTQVRKHAIAALEVIDQPSETLGEQFIIDVYQASQYLPREFGRDTYNEILAVGALNTGSNIDIRKRLTKFYGSLAAQLSNVQALSPYRLLIRRSMLYNTQVLMRNNCNDIVDTSASGAMILSLPVDCKLEMSDEDIQQTISTIRAIGIKHDLIAHASYLDTNLFGIHLISKRIDLIDSYLANLE